MTSSGLEDFQQIVWGYFADFGRDLPWRNTTISPEIFAYHVLVSEFMLQQTQVSRVLIKYSEWLTKYPTIHDVALASLADILQSWNGLGYNRRARYLHETCKQIVALYGGKIPDDVTVLQKLPGIGPNTAAAIVAYAYNRPVAFIETNIRTVFIHHFFADRDAITDAELMPLITSAVDTKQPREWYWALMDYGTYIKKQFGNASRQSKHHVTQSKFTGSSREIRGMVIRQLITASMTFQQLATCCDNDLRLPDILIDLEQEKLIIKTGVRYRLSSH
jgi:A/G-specific adenine glycosylase